MRHRVGVNPVRQMLSSSFSPMLRPVTANSSTSQRRLPYVLEFNWQPTSVEFRALSGSDPSTAAIIHQWDFTGTVPPENPEMLLRINLWLINPPGTPATGQETEIVISNVEQPTPAAAQGGCDNSAMTPVYPLIANIQNALQGGNQNDILAAIDAASAALDDLAARCGRGVSSGNSASVPTTTAPTAVITMDANANYVSGTVSPSNYCNGDYKVALFAYTNQWWVQPFADDRRNIPIHSDCTWASDTNQWDRLVAHLVPKEYDIPNISLSTSCPPLIDATVLAHVCVSR